METIQLLVSLEEEKLRQIKRIAQEICSLVKLMKH